MRIEGRSGDVACCPAVQERALRSKLNCYTKTIHKAKADYQNADPISL